MKQESDDILLMCLHDDESGDHLAGGDERQSRKLRSGAGASQCRQGMMATSTSVREPRRNDTVGDGSACLEDPVRRRAEN